jgi:hypothetical protein
LRILADAVDAGGCGVLVDDQPPLGVAAGPKIDEIILDVDTGLRWSPGLRTTFSQA